MYSPNTLGVDLSSFSIGVPVKPIKEAFGSASLRYFAYPYVVLVPISFPSSSFTYLSFAPKPYWDLCASSAITTIFFFH